jgi:hypothetical protein
MVNPAKVTAEHDVLLLRSTLFDGPGAVSFQRRAGRLTRDRLSAQEHRFLANAPPINHRPQQQKRVARPPLTCHSLVVEGALVFCPANHSSPSCVEIPYSLGSLAGAQHVD